MKQNQFTQKTTIPPIKCTKRHRKICLKSYIILVDGHLSNIFNY